MVSLYNCYILKKTCVTNFVCWHKNRGEKFRTAFRQLGGLRALTSAPFMALTASAPPSIEAEVKATLELHVHDCDYSYQSVHFYHAHEE